MFRAEVIGALLRPSYLKEARAAFEQGSGRRPTSSASRTAPSTT